jgi:hypothetical protein
MGDTTDSREAGACTVHRLQHVFTEYGCESDHGLSVNRYVRDSLPHFFSNSRSTTASTLKSSLPITLAKCIDWLPVFPPWAATATALWVDMLAWLILWKNGRCPPALWVGEVMEFLSSGRKPASEPDIWSISLDKVYYCSLIDYQHYICSTRKANDSVASFPKLSVEQL